MKNLSPVIAEEREHFEAYAEELKAVGIIDSAEKALELRKVLVKYYPELQKTMDQLNLTY